MKLRSVEDIKAAHGSVYDSEQALHDRMEADYDLFRGEPFEVDKGYKSYTPNDAQTLCDKVTDIIAKARRNIRVPIDEEQEEERRVISDTERFVGAALDANDRRLRNLQQPNLQSALSWYAVMRGWVVVRPLVFKGKDKETKVTIDVFDRRWTTYESGPEGLLWVCTETSISPRQAKALYGHGSGKGEAVISVYDFCDEEIHAIIVGQDFFKSPTPHQIGFCPYVVRPVGATPLVVSSVHDDTIADVGESIFANNRNLYQPACEILSDMFSMVNRGRRPPYTYTSKMGDKTLDGDPMKSGAEIPLAEGEQINVLDSPKMPFDTGPLMTFIQGQKQQGGLPSVAYGELGRAISGVTVSLLLNAIGTVIDRRVLAIQEVFSDIAYSLCEQFSLPGLKPLTLEVEKKDVAGKKYYELVKFTRKMIKPYHFDVMLDLALPQDEMQKYMMAQVAKQNQLLSTQTIGEQILKLPDVDLEQDKMLEEFAMRQPTIMLINIIESMYRRGVGEEQIMPLKVELMRMINQSWQQGPPPGQQSQSGVPPQMPQGGPVMPTGTPTGQRTMGAPQMGPPGV